MKETKFEQRAKLLFFVLFTVCFGGLTLQMIFANPYYSHYQWYIILPLALLWGGLFFALWRGIEKFGAALTAHPVRTLVVFFAVLFITQLAFYRWCGAYPTRDFERVFTGAYNYAVTGKIEEPYLDYFYKFPNNLPLMVVLQFYFRILNRLGLLGGVFVAGMLFNAICIDIGYFFLYLAAARIAGRKTALFALGVLYLCVPLHTYISIFYTDTTTLLYPPMIVYFGVCLLQSKSLKQTLLCAAVMGLLTGFGTQLKYSVIIAFIALCVWLLLRGAWKQLLAAAACTAVAFALTGAVLDGFVYRHVLDKSLAYDRATPFLAWIAMGQGGDGTHNPADNMAIWACETHDEKVTMAKTQLAERLGARGFAGTLAFLNKKGLRSFGSGDLNYPNYVSDSPMHQNSAILLLNDTQPYYKAFDRLIQGYHVLIFVLLALGGAAALAGRDRRWYIPQLAAFGMYLFLLLWEAGTRYLLNYYPIFILCALPGFALVFGQLDARLSRKTK